MADGDIPKDILTGIPKVLPVTPGADLHQSHHAGRDDRGCWLFGVGPPIPPLAGKVLRIEQPTTIGQMTTAALFGIGSGGGLCIDPVDGSLYVADNGGPIAASPRTRGSYENSLDKPGGTGDDGTVLVNLINTKLTVVRLAPSTGAVTENRRCPQRHTCACVGIRCRRRCNVWEPPTAPPATRSSTMVSSSVPAGWRLAQQ